MTTDLGAPSVITKWIFPNIGLCPHNLYILNFVLVGHNPKRLSDTRAHVQKPCPTVYIYICVCVCFFVYTETLKPDNTHAHTTTLKNLVRTPLGRRL